MDWYDEMTMTLGQHMKKWIDEQDQLPEREQDPEYRKWKANEEKEMEEWVARCAEEKKEYEAHKDTYEAIEAVKNYANYTGGYDLLDDMVFADDDDRADRGIVGEALRNLFQAIRSNCVPDNINKEWATGEFGFDFDKVDYDWLAEETAYEYYKIPSDWWY